MWTSLINKTTCLLFSVVAPVSTEIASVEFSMFWSGLLTSYELNIYNKFCIMYCCCLVAKNHLSPSLYRSKAQIFEYSCRLPALQRKRKANVSLTWGGRSNGKCVQSTYNAPVHSRCLIKRHPGKCVRNETKRVNQSESSFVYIVTEALAYPTKQGQLVSFGHLASALAVHQSRPDRNLCHPAINPITPASEHGKWRATKKTIVKCFIQFIIIIKLNWKFSHN